MGANDHEETSRRGRLMKRPEVSAHSLDQGVERHPEPEGATPVTSSHQHSRAWCSSTPAQGTGRAAAAASTVECHGRGDGRAAAQERDDASGRAKYVGEDEVAAQVARHGVLVDHRIDDAGDDEAEDHHELNYAVEDARLADTSVLWGANSYETSTVFFVDHMLPNLQRGHDRARQEAPQARPHRAAAQGHTGALALAG